MLCRNLASELNPPFFSLLFPLPSASQALILGEIATLKNKMQLEREERISEDEQIVLAINDYTKALQDGLRIVSAG